MKKLFLALAVLAILASCVRLVMLSQQGFTCLHEGSTPATCTRAGSCELCGRELAAPGHSWQLTESADPGCTVQGYLLYTCGRCGETRRDLIDATGHLVESYTTAKAPTETEDGLEKGKCVRCGETLERSTGLAGTPEYPIQITPFRLYSNSIKDYSRYMYKYVRVSGKVTAIITRDGKTGYFLYGRKGRGLVCWVASEERVATVGKKATFVGVMGLQSGTQIEVDDCEKVK